MNGGEDIERSDPCKKSKSQSYANISLHIQQVTHGIKQMYVV